MTCVPVASSLLTLENRNLSRRFLSTPASTAAKFVQTSLNTASTAEIEISSSRHIQIKRSATVFNISIQLHPSARRGSSKIKSSVRMIWFIKLNDV